MATATISKENMIEAIKNMSMIEVAELVKDLEEIFGVSAAAPVVMGAVAPAAAGGGEAAAAEQTEFSVILVSAGGNKIPVIKEVRAITGLGLKEAKELVDAGGKAIKENVPKEDAEKMKKQLEAVGATVELK